MSHIYAHRAEGIPLDLNGLYAVAVVVSRLFDMSACLKRVKLEWCFVSVSVEIAIKI